MSTRSITTPSIALFGATGGTGLAILKNTLTFDPNAHVNLLCRTPSKITSQYPTTTYPNLHVIEGDIRDLPAIKTTLTDPITQSPVSIVISAVGMLPVKTSFISFKYHDKTICHTAMSNILSMLEELENEGQDTSDVKLVALSSTGISDKGRDIPLRMVPLYYGLLGTPHTDKKNMEVELTEGKGKGRRWVIVRPGWFVDHDEAKGRKVNVGWEIFGKGEKKEGAEKEEDNLVLGFTVSREDVGKWISEEVIKDGGNKKWEGRFVSLTYAYL